MTLVSTVVGLKVLIKQKHYEIDDDEHDDHSDTSYDNASAIARTTFLFGLALNFLLVNLMAQLHVQGVARYLWKVWSYTIGAPGGRIPLFFFWSKILMAAIQVYFASIDELKPLVTIILGLASTFAQFVLMAVEQPQGVGGSLKIAMSHHPEDDGREERGGIGTSSSAASVRSEEEGNGLLQPLRTNAADFSDETLIMVTPASGGGAPPDGEEGTATIEALDDGLDHDPRPPAAARTEGTRLVGLKKTDPLVMPRESVILGLLPVKDEGGDINDEADDPIRYTDDVDGQSCSRSLGSSNGQRYTMARSTMAESDENEHSVLDALQGGRDASGKYVLYAPPIQVPIIGC